MVDLFQRHTYIMILLSSGHVSVSDLYLLRDEVINDYDLVKDYCSENHLVLMRSALSLIDKLLSKA